MNEIIKAFEAAEKAALMLLLKLNNNNMPEEVAIKFKADISEFEADLDRITEKMEKFNGLAEIAKTTMVDVSRLIAEMKSNGAKD